MIKKQLERMASAPVAVRVKPVAEAIHPTKPAEEASFPASPPQEVSFPAPSAAQASREEAEMTLPPTAVSPFARAVPFGSASPQPPAAIRPWPANDAPTRPATVPLPLPVDTRDELDRTAPPGTRSPFHKSALPFVTPDLPDERDRTAPPSARSPFYKSGLPFAPVGPPATPFAHPAPAGHPASPAHPAHPAPAAPATPFAQPTPAAHPMPFAQPAPAAPPALTLEQYASLHAELTVFPAQAEQTFRRYGLLTAAARSALEAEWRGRLAQSPIELARWQGLYRHYCAYWAGTARL